MQKDIELVAKKHSNESYRIQTRRGENNLNQ